MIFFGQGPVTICRLVGGGGRGFLGGVSPRQKSVGGGGCREQTADQLLMRGEGIIRLLQSFMGGGGVGVGVHEDFIMTTKVLSSCSSLLSLSLALSILYPELKRQILFYARMIPFKNHVRRNLRPCQSSFKSFSYRNGPVPYPTRLKKFAQEKKSKIITS